MNASLEIQEMIRRELVADGFADDETSLGVFGREPSPEISAVIEARQGGIFSGESICEAFRVVLGASLKLGVKKREGDPIEPGESLVEISGPPLLVLSTERTLLNFLAVSCGVASLTAKYVEQLSGLGTKLLATRKTIPGLRSIQLQAVVAGGGHVHRRSLSDGVLIKDNHVALAGLDKAIKNAKSRTSPLHRVEVEVDTLAQLKSALEHAPDVVLLDNMSVGLVKEAVQIVSGRCRLEVSGGVDLETIRAYAETGVDYISVGRLTHSAPAFDFSLAIKG